MRTLENETGRLGDLALIAQATAATLVLVLSVVACALSGLLATGLVRLG